MVITRFDPFRGISRLQEEMNRLFDTTVSRPAGSSLTSWAPAVDIYETGDELVVKADLPDISEKDLDVRVKNNMLTITGERKFEKEVNEDNYLRVKRACGSFTRSFALPSTVNADAIKADYRDGVLTLRLPKREESKPRQITVQVGQTGKL